LSDIKQVHDNEQITTFIDDVISQDYEKPGIATYSEWMKFSDDVKIHTVSSILRRPVQVGSGNFDSTTFTTPGDVVSSIRFPDALFTASPNLVDKLNYFLYFRANVHIKIIFNASPFMAGKYWCCFVPFATESNRLMQISVQNQTGYPGNELDIASGAPVMLKIPYCSTLSHYNLITAESSMGDLFITTLNPITSGSSSTVSGFSVFAWFEDIELHVPTSLPVLVNFTAQMKTEEISKTTGPPVSALMTSIGNLARNITNVSPKLAPIAKPVEWISRFMAGGFSAAGFNKPISLSQNTTIDNLPGKFYTHADGVDRSVKLSAMPDNTLPNHQGLFSSTMDEMDINHVISKSAILISNKQWSNIASPGDLLTYWNVTPGLSQLDTNNSQTYFTTPLSFVASIFQQWKGGIKYRVSFAKTGFHSGRIRISFHPGIFNPSAVGDSSYVYNEILDLSVTSEMEFCIPYVANTPWKYAEIFDHGDIPDSKFSTGIVMMNVLTPLMVSSDSVASFVKYNVWISGDSDMSFAIPNISNHVIGNFSNVTQLRSVEFSNMINTIKLSGFNAIDEESDVVKLVDGSVISREDYCRYFEDESTDVENSISSFVYEDGIFKAQIFNDTAIATEHNEQVVDSARNFFSMKTYSPTIAEELCIGEKITNLRQVIKRFSPTFRVLENQPFPSDLKRFAIPFSKATTTDGNLNTLRIDPSYFGDNQGLITNTFQNYSLNAEFNPTTAVSFFATAHVATYLPLNNLTNYISHIYRFYNGSRRYKFFFGGSRKFNYNGSSSAPNVTHNFGRDVQPYVVSRAQQTVLNGAILKPQLISTQNHAVEFPTFSSIVYPDLNGCMEFEVPYYAQTPISLVGQGTITSNEGPLIERGYVFIQQGLDVNGSDYPIYSGDGSKIYTNINGSIFRFTFNGGLLMEAAGDDFNFGYLIGTPPVKRVTNTI